MQQSYLLFCVFVPLGASLSLIPVDGGVSLYPYGELQPGETALPSSDDDSSGEVNLTTAFLFYGTTTSIVYVRSMQLVILDACEYFDLSDQPKLWLTRPNCALYRVVFLHVSIILLKWIHTTKLVEWQTRDSTHILAGMIGPDATEQVLYIFLYLLQTNNMFAKQKHVN